MNYLEEVEFSRQLAPQEEAHVQSRIAPLLTPLDRLRQETNALARDVQRQVSGDQLRIIEELRAHNATLIRPNEEILHRSIQRERELRQSMEQFRAGVHPKQLANAGPTASGPQLTAQLKQLTGELIEALEAINFPQIAKLRKIPEVAAPSFHRVWGWVLDVYFGVSLSKYEWEDFSGKTMTKKHESGRELKRRIIAFDPAAYTPNQRQDLKDLVATHRKLIVDKIAEPELHKFVDTLKIIEQQAEVANQRLRLEVNNTDSVDVSRTKDEEERTLGAEQKLNSTRFDLVSEIQNLYLLIEDEFN